MQTRKLIAVLALAATSALAADGIPPSLQKEAERAFAEGKTYFIWTTNAQPVQGTEGFGMGATASALAIDVQIHARSLTNTPSFRTKAEVDAVDRQDERMTTYMATFPAAPAPGFTFKAPESSCTAWIVAQNRSLKGSGRARVWLIPADSQKAGTNALSNTLEVKVQFKDTK